MAEETAPAAPDASTPEPSEGGKTFTQEQVNDLIAREKGRIQSKYGNYDELKSKAEELDQIKEANASELDKAQSKLTKALQAAEEATTKLLRYEVANEKKIPADAIDLLTGSSKEDLEASADKILSLVKQAEKEPDFDGGAREPTADPVKPEDAHNKDILALMGIQTNT